MMQTMPLPIYTMISCYRGMIDNAIDNLTCEQLEKVIVEAKKLIQTIECTDE